MLIEIDRESWIAGFRDGATRRKGTTVGPPPTVTRDSHGEVRDGYSYNSGWIEGDAKRRGFSYSLGTLRPEDVEPGGA